MHPNYILVYRATAEAEVVTAVQAAALSLTMVTDGKLPNWELQRVKRFCRKSGDTI